MIDIDLIQKRLVSLIFLTILLYHLRFLRMKEYNKSMSNNKTRTFGISWWIGLVLFAGMICLMLGDILHRDGVIGSKTDVLVMGMLDLSRLNILTIIKWLALTLIWRGKLLKAWAKI